MHLIVGLGNPGPHYNSTRHNVGWSVLIQAANRWSVGWTRQGSAQLSQARLGSESVTLALPLAWMNQTGEVVRTLTQDLGVDQDCLIVVHDDLDLETGRLRIKSGGGTGGHNGIRSLISALGTGDFIRVKIGIGRPPAGQESSDYVLSPFSSSESPIMYETVGRAVDALEYLVLHGLTAAMNQFNIRTGDTEEL